MMRRRTVRTGMHGLDGEIDQHDRILGDDAHQHQHSDHDGVVIGRCP